MDFGPVSFYQGAVFCLLNGGSFVFLQEQDNAVPVG
jgi:hypothetical protein